MEFQFKVPNVPLISTVDFGDNQQSEIKHDSHEAKIPSNVEQRDRKERESLFNKRESIKSKDCDEKRLCTSCSKIFIQTLAPIQTCIQNLLNLTDPQVLSEYQRKGYDGSNFNCIHIEQQKQQHQQEQHQQEKHQQEKHQQEKHQQEKHQQEKHQQEKHQQEKHQQEQHQQEQHQQEQRQQEQHQQEQHQQEQHQQEQHQQEQHQQEQHQQEQHQQEQHQQEQHQQEHQQEQQHQGQQHQGQQHQGQQHQEQQHREQQQEQHQQQQQQQQQSILTITNMINDLKASGEANRTYSIGKDLSNTTKPITRFRQESATNQEISPITVDSEKFIMKMNNKVFSDSNEPRTIIVTKDHLSKDPYQISIQHEKANHSTTVNDISKTTIYNYSEIQLDSLPRSQSHNIQTNNNNRNQKAFDHFIRKDAINVIETRKFDTFKQSFLLKSESSEIIFDDSSEFPNKEKEFNEVNYIQSNPQSTQEQIFHKDYSEKHELEDRSPFAYVTIVSNNLSAINAILLANSIYIYNNHHLNVLKNGWQIEKRYLIPLVALINNRVDIEIRSLIDRFYDQVIELNSNDLVLLNDESLGIQHIKVHLWKELADKYSKCIYLESNTLVVGQISNLFLECEELSASVDCFFPDYFNCSVFVFEPNQTTYKELIQYGIRHRLNVIRDDTIETDSLDEITLLNEFFRTKWRKLSFIYNFIRNDLTYTQRSAYLKFGANICVFNFGNQGIFSNNPERFSMEPWNYKFDLRKASLEGEPFKNNPIDDFSKFYLLLFIRRLWPLLSKKLSPLILSQNKGVREWSVQELAQIIGLQSGTNNNCIFDQKSFTLRLMTAKIEDETTFNYNPEENISSDSQKQLGPSTDTNVTSNEILIINKKDDDQDGDNKNKSEEKKDVMKEKLQSPKRIPQEQLDWEHGRIDWMYQHQSDKIINRLLTKF